MIWVVDTETTGGDPQTGAVCEVAAVSVTEEGKVEGRSMLSSLVNPGHPIPPDMRGVHHIGDEDVCLAPKLGGVMRTWRRVRSATKMAAHNAEFDRTFLAPHLTSEVEWICTLRCALHLYPEAPNHRCQTLRYYLGCEPPRWMLMDLAPHRALYDAVVAAHILATMLKERSAEDLVSLTGTPVVLRRVDFGAHRGKLWEQVPYDYLCWVAKRDFRADVVNTARHWINQGRSR